MDSDTLHTASTYLNNLLLARGLLRNGKALDFAKPTRDTRAQIINLVHDLLLRRDRDQENREQIALTLRTLRTDQTRKDADLEKLQTRMGERERNLVQAQTEARNAKVEMRRMESSVKTLQDQLAKLKMSVGHIKTQCNNDIRKRDMHIERLKTHLQGQQRGNKGGVIAPTMNITGGVGSGNRAAQSFDMSVRQLEDPEYSLKQESNDFLTQLSQSLSDENDGLIAMLRGTLQTMKELLGLDKESPDHRSDCVGEDVENTTGIDLPDEDVPISYDALATEVESTLEVLRTVLTSADFVSMEEVEQRDEEIVRLREGWVMMEARWKEVLLMMNSWRTKMDGGDTINLDDLKRGLGLGEGLSDGLSSPTKPDSTSNGHHHENGPQSPSEDSDQASGRDSGIGHQGQHSSLQPQSHTKKPPSLALDPPELFQRNQVKERHLRRLSPNVQSPRKVAFVETAAKNSPLLYKEDGYETAPSIEYTQVDKPRSERTSRGQRSAPASRNHGKASRLVSDISKTDYSYGTNGDTVSAAQSYRPFLRARCSHR